MGLFGNGNGPAVAARPAAQQATKKGNARHPVDQLAALVAASMRVRDDNSQELSRLTLPWQARALAHYDNTPEAWYAAQFYARPLSKLRLYPAIFHPDGIIEPSEDPAAWALLDRIRDPSGGHSQILGNYGRLQFLTGDGYLTVTEDPRSLYGEVWEYLSTQEIRLSGDGRNFFRQPAPNVTPVTMSLDNGAVDTEPGLDLVRVWRLWRKHPVYSLWPDSPMNSVLDLMDQLQSLDRSANARIISRLAGSGLLAVADEITLAPPDADVDDEDLRQDPLWDDFAEHVMAPIANPGTAAELVPFILRIPTLGRPISELIHHFKLYDANESFPEMDRQTQLIERIALGLDMPAESLTKKGESNHWGAWQVTEDEWKAHQEPMAIQFCVDVTASYFRPAAVEENLNSAEMLGIWYDAAQVVVHPDRGKDAQAVFDRGELSGEALRTATGFTYVDAPSDEERLRYLAIKMRDPVLAEAVAGEEKVSPTGGGEDRTPPESPPPEEPVVAATNGHVDETHVRAAVITGAAEFAVTRARALAGAKIRSKVLGDSRTDRACEECMSRIDGVEQHLVASVLGEEMVANMRMPAPSALVKGTDREFASTVQRLGIPAEHAQKLGVYVERHAAQTLFDADPPPLPANFNAYLVRVVVG